MSARPADADCIQAYVAGLSAASRYNRFLGQISELGEAELDRITNPRDESSLTLIAEACAPGAGTIVGEARYAISASSCECALSVADRWQRRGLGTLLMSSIECRARSLGARAIVADVLRSNQPMKELARKVRFAMAGVPAEARLVRIVKDISDAQSRVRCDELMASAMRIAA